MNNQPQATRFKLNFYEGYAICFESAPCGFRIECLDTRENQRIYQAEVADIEDVCWAMGEIHVCLQGYEAQLAEMKAEHSPEVLRVAKELAQMGIKNALAAAYSARPMRPSQG